MDHQTGEVTARVDTRIDEGNVDPRAVVAPAPRLRGASDIGVDRTRHAGVLPVLAEHGQAAVFRDPTHTREAGQHAHGPARDGRAEAVNDRKRALDVAAETDNFMLGAGVRRVELADEGD